MSTASIAGYRIGEKMGDQMSRSWVRTGFDQLLQDCLNAVLITAISIFIEVEFFNIHTWEGAFFFASSLALALTALQQWLFEFSKDSLPWHLGVGVGVFLCVQFVGYWAAIFAAAPFS
jgi:hypothetical protein